MDLVLPVIAPVVESLVVPVRKNLSFMLSSTEYVKAVEHRMQHLKYIAQDIKALAGRNAEADSARVEDWLLNVEQLNQRSNSIESVGCFSVTKRYKVGKRCYDILEQIRYLEYEASRMEFTHTNYATTGDASPLSSTEYSGIPHYPDIDKREEPNLPSGDLTAEQSGERYFKICVPLFEASMRCDWNTAKAVFDRNPDYVKYGITENKETVLHLVSSKKQSKHVKNFVKKLVSIMEPKDLELENKSFSTALYMAAVAGNIDTVKIMVEKNRKLLTIMGGSAAANKRLMPLHAAALFGNHQVVRYLYEKSIDLSDHVWNQETRSWLLEKCVEGDMFDVALKIVKAHPGLGSEHVLKNLAGKPDVFSEKKSNVIKRIQKVFASIGLAKGAYEHKGEEALQVLKIIWEDIVKKRKNDIDEILRGPLDSQNLIQVLPIQKLIYDQLGNLRVRTKHTMEKTMSEVDKYDLLQKLFDEHLMNMHNETDNLIQKDYLTFSRKGGRTLELQNLIYEHIVNISDEFQNIKMHQRVEECQRYIQKLISKHITEMYALSGLNREKYSSRIPFIAAEIGNTKFLVELIHRYPELIWKVNDDNQTIFHIAVKYRHEGIYNLLYEIGSMKDFVIRHEDADDNNMLHLVGKRATQERLAIVSGPALQMQRELLWFKEVRNMMHPDYRERKNKDGLTPRELFAKEHKELIREGEKWIKGAASQCMVVATLIATIVFAAAFTIPGGYNQTYGIPIFCRKPIFVVFVVADAISLVLSSTSILTFLSILTSRYAEHDFVGSLPKKLMLGISTLFLSITAMMVTFSVSFFILYHKEMKWIPISISVFAVTPVLLYVVLQYHLLVDVIRSTYGSKYLFKPGKQVLYYVNPKV